MSDALLPCEPRPGGAPAPWPAGRGLLCVALLLCLFGTTARGQRLTLGAHDGVVTAVAFSPDGRYLATGCEDGHIKLWSTATRLVAYSLPDPHDPARISDVGEINALCFSADSQVLYSADPKHKILTWQVSLAGRNQRTNGSGIVCSLAASPDGRLLAMGETDGRTGPSRADLTAGWINTETHIAGVTGLFWESDSLHYLSVDALGYWKRWGQVKGKEFFRGAPAAGLVPATHDLGGGPYALSPDRRVVASIGRVDGAPRVRLHKFPSLEPITELVSKAGELQDLRSIAFATDGRTVGTGGVNGTLHFWDITRSLVGAGLLDGAALPPNAMVQPLPPNPWPALTKKLALDSPNYAGPPRGGIYFETPGPDRFVVGVRKIENGVVTGLGEDMRIPRLGLRADPGRLNVLPGNYAFFWRKLTEPGVVHTLPQKVTIIYREKRSGNTTEYTWRNVVMTLDGKDAKPALREETMPGALKR